jgi:hypothetical protein
VGYAAQLAIALLVTVPTGMIVFGAAAAVASALHTGLRAKILGWMGVQDPLQLPPAGEPGDKPESKPGDAPKSS